MAEIRRIDPYMTSIASMCPHRPGICMYVYMYLCMYLCTVCMYCMYICMYVCIYMLLNCGCWVCKCMCVRMFISNRTALTPVGVALTWSTASSVGSSYLLTVWGLIRFGVVMRPPTFTVHSFNTCRYHLLMYVGILPASHPNLVKTRQLWWRRISSWSNYAALEENPGFHRYMRSQSHDWERE